MQSWRAKSLTFLILLLFSIASCTDAVVLENQATELPALEEEAEPNRVMIIDTTQVLRPAHPGFMYLNQYMNAADFDMRYYSQNNFVGDTIDGYESAHCLISIEAGVALRHVQDDAERSGLRLKIFDAYRPQRAVDHFKRWSLDLTDTLTKAQYYPSLQKSSLFNLGYIAEKSQHSRGAAVDLTLVYGSGPAEGEELDMGTPFDYFGSRSGWDTPEITEEQKANRLILKELMRRHGFRSIKGEWWHFVLIEEPFPGDFFDFPVK